MRLVCVNVWFVTKTENGSVTMTRNRSGSFLVIRERGRGTLSCGYRRGDEASPANNLLTYSNDRYGTRYNLTYLRDQIISECGSSNPS